MAHPFTRGLHDTGNGCFAFLQPDGGWGLSNAGLVTCGKESLLIDTLQSVSVAREMVDEMCRATPAAEQIGSVVNTHSHGDHTRGNELFPAARIISSAVTTADIKGPSIPLPEDMIAHPEKYGTVGQYMRHIMGDTAREIGVAAVAPNVVFEKRMDVQVGNKIVQLHEVPLAHTRSDVIAYSPSDRTVFTGDLLFHEVHPILGAGPVQNWIDACEFMLGLDCETVIPGHGPITDKSGIQKLRDYIVFIREEATKRHKAGMSSHDAVRDISYESFRGWPDQERVVLNVIAIYRELGDPEAKKLGFMESFALMGAYFFEHNHDHNLGHKH